MSLHKQAMLSVLEISVWSGKFHDKQLARESEVNHGMKSGVASSRVSLLDKNDRVVAELNAAKTDLYEWHKSQTVPFTGRGVRLFATRRLFDLRGGMRTRIDRFERATEAFCAVYDEIREQARQDLGDRAAYARFPKDIRKHFGVSWRLLPVPTSGACNDLVDVSAQERNILEQEVSSDLTKTYASIAEEAVARVQGFLLGNNNVDGLISRLEKSRWKGDVLREAREIAEVLEPLAQISGRQSAIDMVAKLKNLSMNDGSQHLKKDKILRESLLQQAKGLSDDCGGVVPVETHDVVGQNGSEASVGAFPLFESGASAVQAPEQEGGDLLEVVGSESSDSGDEAGGQTMSDPGEWW